MDSKTCTKCEEEKSVDEFYYDKRYKKPSSWCKECVKEKNRQYRKNKKKEALKKDKFKKEGKAIIEERECPICFEIKPDIIENFRMDRKGCTDCERDNGREYRRDGIGKKKAKKWVEENSERMAKLQADWYQDNKPKIYEKYIKRYHTEPEFKVKALTKTRIHDGLNRYKKSGIAKSKKSVKYLGSTFKQYVEWLIFCFKDDTFTMDNHGEYWQIDHVIPIATFDLSDTLTHDIAFNWRNTMPLTKEENMAKKDKIDIEQIKTHIINLIEFHKLKKIEMPSEFTELYAKHLTMIRETP